MWNFLKWIILTVHVMGLSQGYPIKQSGNGLEVPPAEVLNFMRRFGYLDKNPDNSEALYHESAIVEALKNIQKYGAINQTGKLDDMTLELFTKPRCGVPDIEGKPYYLKQHETVTMGAKHRQKRFIFGAKTWTKRNIKYLIGNRSLKIPREQVERDLARAFDVWSQYSNLKFHRVYDTSADIIVGFGSQYHGDNYPFDGAGNILAHAFYPYEMGSWGGDVHFDEDENWKENSPDLSQGVDFYTVALHELGHSLGLAHSPSHSSIMFPYYKGPDYNILDYDDTLAMYEAYLNKKLDDDDLEPSSEEQQMEDEGDDEDKDNAYNGYDEARYSTPVPVEETSKSYYEPEMSYNSTTVTTDSGYATTPMANSSYTNTATTVYNPNTEAATTTNFYPSLGTTAAIPYPTTDTISDSSPFPPPIPNICEGGFNAVCYFNGSTHIFKGQYVWKISSQYRVINGYPKLLQDVIVDLPQNILEIDACYERYDKTVLFFTGQIKIINF
ncbi:matrilysin [Stomoxys calcitrans]|uniref:matrilysin n=1 Tax=Stomoxys calcitrans TaxID=35570 RepID=UPI0027E3178C|nr:matrilysin [Stomoxys calcitrans]